MEALYVLLAEHSKFETFSFVHKIHVDILLFLKFPVFFVGRSGINSKRSKGDHGRFLIILMR